MIVAPFVAKDQLAIHDVTWQFRKVAGGGCIREDQSGVLNPAGAGIKSWAAFGLVRVSRQKMHDDRAVPFAISATVES